MQTFFLAPISSDVGLTSTVLGLLRAFEQAGLKVGFIKPISQTSGNTLDLSTHFVRILQKFKAPTPISMERAEHLMSSGAEDQLMEEIVSLYQTTASQVDVMIVEGLVANPRHVFVSALNSKMAQNLQADVILVASAQSAPIETLADQLELAIPVLTRHNTYLAACIINRIPNQTSPDSYLAELFQDGDSARAQNLKIAGAIPYEPNLLAPRSFDIAQHLHARMIYEGQLMQRRVKDIHIVARSVPHMTHLLRPGALIVTPGDRDDVIMAVALATMNGVPLAGLLLTSDTEPDPNIWQLCHQAFSSGLPVFSTALNSYETAASLDNMNKQIPADDIERMENVVDFVSSHIELRHLLARIEAPKEKRLTPPAFRYQLIQKAKAANKRIVLPEGNEQRTIQAAIICHEKRIAHCVLLGNPFEIEQIAKTQGLVLPSDIEIFDPQLVRQQYIAPMVEKRKNKGLNAPMAERQLEDNVVLGTMMLAMNEVDGLVSGAVHTTANTIRPALQLIKTSPTAKIVSSVFFMLMPEQVLVYGDCAVNPDPSAEELADIAIQSADSALAFGIVPKVTMISYSTGASGSGSDVEKVREATRIAKEKRPELLIDGPMQYDAASVKSVGAQKAPDSPVAGQATVFIFPDLNTGNTTYKAVQRSANVVSVGPMLQGLNKPVNDLSRGALVDDIVYTIALTAIQADTQTAS